MQTDLVVRASRHAALGDPHRLAIVDALVSSDRSPAELQVAIGCPSNLLAHHLDVLEDGGLITRHRSTGDGRRRYVTLVRDVLSSVGGSRTARPQEALFVCSLNSARSQLAAGLWQAIADAPAESAGTHPARRVHPGAIAAGRRVGLDLSRARPRSLEQVGNWPALVITVCDRAHEELLTQPSWLHWSIPDPVADGRKAAFDATVVQLRRRITDLVAEAS